MSDAGRGTVAERVACGRDPDPRRPLTPPPVVSAGLAHVSEVADDFVKDLAQLFNPGQRERGAAPARLLPAAAVGTRGRLPCLCCQPASPACTPACLPLPDPCACPPRSPPRPGAGVVARVLKVERDAGRLSLGLKPSYFEDARWVGGWEGRLAGQAVDGGLLVRARTRAACTPLRDILTAAVCPPP